MMLTEAGSPATVAVVALTPLPRYPRGAEVDLIQLVM
jgi:hypothetical protein